VSCSYAAQLLFFIIKCGIARFLCTCTHYAHIQRSGIILTPPVPNSVSVAPSIAELADGEKSHTQSINQSPNQSLTHLSSLFDGPGTEAFTSEQIQ